MIYLFAFNVFTFLMMFIDKQCAIHHLYRVPEKVIFLLGLVGGAVGIYVGMFFFHHKTRKILFLIYFPVVILIQGYFLWLYLK